jgi:hypothetical protein
VRVELGPWPAYDAAVRDDSTKAHAFEEELATRLASLGR